MSLSNIAKTLEECIQNSLREDTKEFQWDVFYKEWFRDQGCPCFFLFKKHLGVTNTQFVELFSLLQTYCLDTYSNKPKTQLLLHKTEDIRETIVETLNSVLDSRSVDKSRAIREFSERYAEILSSTVAVDMFYCSAAISLPPGLEVDLEHICADSGYIHSAGKSIFIRNLKKARVFDFNERINSHIETMGNIDFPIPFVVYAHEDFTGHDSSAKEQISRGIETTKIFVEKMSMGTYRLSEIIEGMKAEYKGKLIIPPAGPYGEHHKFRKQKTLWLISDRSLSTINPMNPGRGRYYICYEQSVRSENPFFLFDENKPGWKSHTTLPHSLTAALINITRPHTTQTVLCDPFGGTGTTWLESKRLNLSVSMHSSDESPISPLMVKDNLKFFLSSAAELLKTGETLRRIDDAIKQHEKDDDKDNLQASLNFPIEDRVSSIIDPYLLAKQWLEELKTEQPNEDQEFCYSSSFVEKLEGCDIITRFIFYVVLRAELRYQGGYKRQSTVFQKAFSKSMAELIGQIEQLRTARLEIEESLESDIGKNYRVFQGIYSKEVISSIFLCSPNQFDADIKTEVAVRDARALKKDSLDIIICDPPYGFNTTEDQGELATLYSEFLGSAIQALRKEGHLIICLPAESYTGGELPYCTRSNMISNQVLIKARSLERLAYLPAKSVPVKEFSPPYYWEAERALRRVILHFRIL